MIKLYKYKIYCILLTTIIAFPLASKEVTSMIGYWLTSQSIVHIKICSGYLNTISQQSLNQLRI